MRAWGEVGAPPVTATDHDPMRGHVPVPTQPLVRPASWPARPDRSSWASPIRLATDSAAAAAAERDAAAAAAEQDRAALAAIRSTRTATSRPTTPGKPAAARVEARQEGRRAQFAAVIAEHGPAIRAAWADPRLSIQEIGDRVGLPRHTVRTIAHHLGLPARANPVVARTEIDLDAAAAEIAAGVSFKALAARLGVSDRCLRDRLRAAEMHRPPRRGALGEMQGRALPLLREGRSVRQVAGQLGVSEATVTRWRDEAGIPARPVGVTERSDR